MKYLNSRTPGEILISHEKRDESNRQETLASVWSMTAVVFEKGSSDNETRPTNSIDSFIVRDLLQEILVLRQQLFALLDRNS